MTDPDRLTANAEAQEMLDQGREHMIMVQVLADTMVWALGTVYDDEPSRTFTWRGEDCAYYLGRGAWWEKVTGQPMTNENWLMVMPDLTDTSAARLMTDFALHRISPDNDQLAGNQELREHVASILHAGVASEILNIATEAFPPQEAGKPGKGSIFYDGTTYILTVFGDAADPFMFVDAAGVRYDLGPDSPLERFDLTQEARHGKYIAGGPEQRLLHMLQVIHGGERQVIRPRVYVFSHDRIERSEPYFPTDLPQHMDQDARATVSSDIVTIADLTFENNDEALYLWEEDTNLFGLRTLVPNVLNGEPAAVGMVSDPYLWVVEVLSLAEGMPVRHRVVMDLRSNTAFHYVTEDDVTERHDDSAAAVAFARSVMDAMVAAYREGSLQSCPHEVGEQFQHPVIKIPPRRGDTVK